MDYNDCYKKCNCFYYDKGKKECIFKSLCVTLELPIENNEVEVNE